MSSLLASPSPFFENPLKYWKIGNPKENFKIIRKYWKNWKTYGFPIFPIFGGFCHGLGPPCRESTLGIPEQTPIDFLWISNQNWKKGALRQPRAVLLYFQLNSNWKWKEIYLRQPKADSDWFSIEFSLKTKGNLPEALQGRFWLILTKSLIDNERKFVWGSPEPVLMGLKLNSN